MASAWTSVNQSNWGNFQKSCFQQTICLADWWLVKAGNGAHRGGLAVAGFSSREKQAMRVFSSAPILRRYDVFTLETIDGICVILNGVINRDRTLENGFPSDVCNYFVFGFPPYWEEYHIKFLGNESSSKNISVNLRKKPSPYSGMEGGQMHVGSHEKKNKSLAVELPQKCGSIIICSKDNLNMSRIASEDLEKESYSGGSSGEYHTTPELPVNCLKMKIKSLSNISCEGKINVSDFTDKDEEYSQIHDSREIPSAYHLYHGRRKRAKDNSRNVESGKNISTMANFDRDKGIREIKTKSNVQKVKNKATKALQTSAAVVNKTEKIIAGKNRLSEKAKTSGVEIRRKSAYVSKETPDDKKEKVLSTSPKSFSFNRSRSGRLLMPSLEFWRNQRAVYDMDRTITGIEEGTDKQPIIESGYKSKRKYWKRKQRSTRMVHKT